MVSARRPLSQIDKLDNVQKGPSAYTHMYNMYALIVAIDVLVAAGCSLSFPVYISIITQ